MPADPSRSRLAVLVLAVAALLCTACGGSDDPATTAGTSSADPATAAESRTTAQDGRT